MERASNILSQVEFFRQETIHSLMHWLERTCEGAVMVDREGRVVWINQTYLDMLGFSSEQVVSKPLHLFTPHSRMLDVIHSGEPILLDVWTIGEHTFIISRVPVKDRNGEVMGAIGFALYESSAALKPLLAKFARMQTELDSAKRELASIRRNRYTLACYHGNSNAMQELKRKARRAARLDSPVLLLGETGTGKELLAHGIHAESARVDKPFVALNMAAIPDTLLEVEFFGAAPSAYTGADRKGRDGKFKLADGGTLFLDEIGDLPLNLQAKLLRALQEQEIEPVGSNRVHKINVRVIAATSVDLPQMVASGRFRADLYYRLNVLPLKLPPLRERREDMDTLCEHLLGQIARQNGTPHRDIDPAGLALLRVQPWPGNVRELRNVLEQACAMSDALTLTANDFRDILPMMQVETVPQSLAEAVANTERGMIREVLRQCSGKVGEAALRLGVSRATLYKKMAVLQINS